MSTIESQSGPAASFRRNRTPDVPLTGITGRLETPGLAITPPVSESARTLDGLLSAFSSLGGLSAQIVRQRAHDEAAAEARAKLAADAAREVETADRGLSNTHAGIDLPEIEAAIRDGSLRPEEGESIRDFSYRIAREGTEGQSPAYIARRVEVIADRAALALQRRVERNRVQAATDNAALAVQSIDGATTPDRFEEAVAAIRTFDPEVSQWVAEAEVGQRWLRNAVDTANVDPDRGAAILAAARARLGDRLGTEQLVAQSKLDAAIRGARADGQEATRERFFGLVNSDAPTDTMRAFLAKEAGNLDQTQLADLYRVVDVRERAALADAQGAGTNALVRDVTLRRWAPDETGSPSPAGTVNEVVRRMDLAPTDPNFIDADRGTSLLNTIAGAARFDARAERVRTDMRRLLDTNSAATVRPAIPDDDSALLRNYAEAGIVAATPQGVDGVVLDRITDPTRFAFYSRNFNRVPGDAEQLIRAGLSSPNPAQFRDAAATYAALTLQAPHLARSIEMDQTTAMRARYIASRVERAGPSVLVDNAALARQVGNLSDVALKLDPTLAEYTREQVLGRVYDKDAKEQARPDFTRTVRELAVADIKAGVFESESFKAAGIKQGRNLFGNTRLDNVPDALANSYAKYLDEEFRYARSITPSETAAAKAAKAWALDRALADHPPYTWGGTVMFGRKGEPALPQEVLIDDLATPPNDHRVNPEAYAKWAKDRTDDLLTNYVPTWDARQGGYVFRSIADPYALFTEWTEDAVGPLVLDPFAPDTKTADLTKQIDAAINARRAKKRGSTDAAPRPSSLDQFGRRRFGGLE